MAPRLHLLEHLGDMLGHLGGKLGPESAKMATKRARWSQHRGAWRLPDRKDGGGWRVNDPVWGPIAVY